jgi:hypothetical protein
MHTVHTDQQDVPNALVVIAITVMILRCRAQADERQQARAEYCTGTTPPPDLAHSSPRKLNQERTTILQIGI